MDKSQAKPPTAREKVARLRADFIAQLPGRVADLRALHERLGADPTDRAAAAELHRILHNLKGTGRSFGYPELGEASARGESIAAMLLETPDAATAPDWPRIAEAIELVASAASRTGATVDGDHGTALAGFSLPDKSAMQDSEERGRLVYICDDDPVLLDMLANQLNCFGYDTATFLHTQVLRDAILARSPDAVIMDIHFPEGHTAGTEMLAAIARETRHAVPTIFLSGRDDFQARLAAVQAGGEAYFRKPTHAMELVVALDELTNQQKPEPYRILIVDDERAISDYHAIILQEAGMVTYQVNEPSRILDVLREFRPDMVLMDMYMPDCSGRDLAKLIRQVPDHVGLPIVYLSSETDKQKQFTAMRIGAEGFLTKPVVPGELVAAVAIRAERMRNLRSLMARDSLTGLFNHTTTTQLLENTIAAAKRGGGSLCFVMIDIDRFKSVNDTYGHAAGDQVIIAIARVLQQRLRNSDIVGRYGGEEFAAILLDVTLEQANRLIDELRQDFAQVVFHAGDSDFSCTFSAGIAHYPKHRRPELLREAADKALYEAKRGGRNRVVVDKETG